MSFRERLQFTWTLTWPLIVIDLAWAVLLHLVVEGGTTSADSLFQVFSFFVLGPAILRWALNRGTPLHRVVAIRRGAESTLSIADALAPFWLIAWRSLIFMLLALLPLSLLLKSIVPPEFNQWIRSLAASPLSNSLGLTVVDVVTNMAIVPFLIPAMLSKRYKQFTLELRSRETAPQMNSVSRKHFKRNLSKR
ncbi:MAG: hypothetical protein ABI823_05590 [Bryobacteraceae bacterium]